jgi:NADH dehydrogenase [ubiquinone] 1 alpha subcomplex assembly factor 1
MPDQENKSSLICSTLLNFDTPNSVLGWTSVDDVVMGGISCSRLNFNPNGHAEFIGEVSLDNNGGFASVRSAPSNYSAINTKKLRLCVLGDRHHYKLNLRMDNFLEDINYQALFQPSEKWSEFIFDCNDFKPRLRGRPIAAPPLDFSRIHQIGFMISGRQAGAFTLFIRWLRTESYL